MPVTIPAELVIDVSAAVEFDEPIQLAATVHLPAGAPRATLVCWPGGSYGRVYWDMHIPGHPGYSFAEHLSAQGYLVVAADHLGVGASGKPADGDRVNFESVSDAAAAFVDRVRELLAAGAPEVGGTPMPELPVVGVGHSLGACLVAVTQARHRSYDAVALLGFTHGSKDAVSDVGATAVEQARAFFDDSWDEIYAFAPREPNHAWLHAPDVPADVIAADDALAERWPRQCYIEALTAGYSTRFADRIDCSVFLGFGDSDVPERPHEDVAFYPRSHDVTLYVLAGSAHCHNFAGTRTRLWDRIAVWAGGLKP